MPQADKHPVTPEDTWDFLPGDDDLTAPEERSGEESAMHRIPDTPPVGIDDVARRESDVGFADDETSPVAWFDDEEPDLPYARATADDETVDVEDLLVAQHYAFADEASDDLAADNGDETEGDETEGDETTRVAS